MSEFLKVMDDWKGFNPVRKPRFSEAQITRTLDLISNKEGMPAYKQEYLLKEVITTDDFPNLFGFVVDREMLARYKMWVADWKTYFKMGTVVNFNTVQRHKVQGQDEILDEVAEKGEYLEAESSEGFYSYHVKKYGRQFDISWESVVNDVLNAFGDIPQRFADAAIRSEAYAATSVYCAATGPNPALFGAAVVDAADGGVINNIGALALSVANLETTLGLMSIQPDINGNPISVRAAHLVVPPQLEMTARAILTSTTLLGTAAAPLPALNILPQMGLKLHVDPFLPIIDVTADDVSTWYLFGEPSLGAAMEFGYLRGHETPEICMKASNKVSVSGAPLSPFTGDFESDDILYRVRDVFGTCVMDPRFAYAQIG